MSDVITLSFADLADTLANMHWVADSRRSAFQARLKNFLRFGFPLGFQMSKGKTARFSPGHAIEMALAVELTQLGLPPERVVNTLLLNWYSCAMAVRLATDALLTRLSKGDDDDAAPPATFLVFDPTALWPLTFDASSPDLVVSGNATFFYGGERMIRDNIVNWTSNNTSRISLINVNSILSRLAADPVPDNEIESADRKSSFLLQLFEWAVDRTENGLRIESATLAPEQASRDFLWRFLALNYAPPKTEKDIEALVVALNDFFGSTRDRIRQIVRSYGADEVSFNGDD